MNLKKHAERLSGYLEDELKQELPIAVMQDGSIGYKNFRIKKNKRELWVLRRVGGNPIDSFNLKACALMAAKYYSLSSLAKYNEIKSLDTVYQQNATDTGMFRERYLTVKDPDRKDLYLWRMELTESRAMAAKSQIVRKFKSVF